MGETLRSRGEHALLEDIRRLAGGRDALRGPGDDAALLPRSRHPLLATTDALVEGVHFRSHWLDARALGRRLFAVNASDIAAMGGRPLAALLAVAAPPATSVRALRGIVRGVAEAGRKEGTPLVGGNLASARTLILTLTLFGEATGSPVTRAGGRPGDHLFVTGDLGAAALGLRHLRRIRTMPRRTKAIERWRHPESRLRAGQVLGRRRLAAAMIDLSDGFLVDADRLCRASGVGAIIVADDLPLSPHLRSLTPSAARALALTGGEDYELLFAVRSSRLAALRRDARLLGCPIRRVGRLVRAPGLRLVDGRGKTIRLPRRTGHAHFVTA